MRRLFNLLLVVIFISNLAGCTMSNGINLREGIDNFRLEEYRKAFIRLKPLAQKGQPDAQYAVGYMYYYGKGVVEDRKKAWFWINAAANLGQPDAKEAIRILARGGSLS
ncbi:SEL1-like repeat protein [Fluoribacter gormanii]|uniref:Sel1 repeat n=1 Tax=Fluoribacter gormanii TaxID=464 RepID=A0A377GH40_9GAMM|nr:SEL1-like repeat protein [Fluoribacter gormanii]KTD02145.1 Sel-1 protein [Fluoribacter gormanii]MCW8444330.1 SEL1-like repeat protein [Fluoribacter gormanii]MCW8469521.1 SEL1-like repeat protein [Fluoribacter gormanii]SIR51328.1 Sel1 repeat-containing protein [Fluoribacter gormanii]STO24150.1 Sel1 repeat [Fluoribacter gormanii]